MKKRSVFVIFGTMLLFTACSSAQTTNADKGAENAVVSEAEENENNIVELTKGTMRSLSLKIKDPNPSAEDIKDTINKIHERAKNLGIGVNIYITGDEFIVQIPKETKNAETVLLDITGKKELYFIAETDENGNKNYEYYDAVGAYDINRTIEALQTDGSIVVDGNDVSEAKVDTQIGPVSNQTTPVVCITLTEKGAEKFGDATMNAYANGETIGIYYDDQFISVPMVQAPITDGNCVITGLTSFEDADNMATNLNLGHIKLDLEPMEYSDQAAGE